LTTSNIPSTISISNPIVTTTTYLESTPPILTSLLPNDSSTIPYPIILTTRDENFTLSTMSTTEISTISFSPPNLTTTEENKEGSSSTSTEIPATFTFSSPIVTTNEEIITEPQTTSKFTSSYTLPPPTILTTSDYTQIPIETSSDPISTTVKFPPKKSTYFTLFPPTIFTTSQKYETTTKSHEITHPIDTSSKIPSTSIPTTKTSEIPGTTCPTYPDICPDNNNPNFGDNNIDPRLVRPKRQFINGCPCIDIRSALKLLLQNGMLGSIKHELLEEIKEAEFVDEIEILPVVYPKNRLAWN
jgi:hypothetical protein